MSDIYTKIFKAGSKTYFYSSLFFPKEIRKDVFILYSFVRTADDFVDAVPQQKKAFYDFVGKYKTAQKGGQLQDEIINSFCDLMKRKQFDPAWVDAFLFAMESDMKKAQYNTIAETESYMYGSAEVIGLMMSAIMELPKTAYPSAQKLGKAMQYVNFIRDVQEDNDLGRIYLPFTEMKKAGLGGLLFTDAQANPAGYTHFITNQLDRYLKWQTEAEEGFHFIPSRYRIPIKTASDMYRFTAMQIKNDPFLVYKRKVKPSIYQILGAGFKNTVVTHVNQMPFPSHLSFPRRRESSR